MKVAPDYLNGQFVVAAQTIPVIDPATGNEFATASIIERDHVAAAIRDAHTAFLTWRQVPGKDRGDFLRAVAAELFHRREEIARLITMENGKPLAQSQGEISLAVDHLRWFAEEARRGYGRVIPPLVESKRHLVIKQPIGVVAAITPWNFPLMLAARKVGAILAAGCTVILKPARKTPLSGVALAECIAAAHPAKGVFQLVAGDSGTFAAEFLANPLCRKISFTGSTEVGRELIRGAGRTVKPLSLELGGNAPVLVFDDCELDEAVKGVMLAKFRNTGQSCVAANRIYVHRTLYPGFLQLLTKRTRELKLGDGLSPESQVGPLIDEVTLDRVQEHVTDALQGGARLLCGGQRAKRPGYFYEPTVLGDVARNSLCMFEEMFAPVAAVTPFDTESEAIELANNSEYGLAAYVFTNDLKRALRVAEQLECGIVGVNDGVPTASPCPFGGSKQSGWGRELGLEGMDAFLETKYISIGMD
jgi:succinate-semialdehyde dehydrogenase/glutarate-semialdehyde dehydrogenase